MHIGTSPSLNTNHGFSLWSAHRPLPPNYRSAEGLMTPLMILPNQGVRWRMVSEKISWNISLSPEHEGPTFPGREFCRNNRPWSSPCFRAIFAYKCLSPFPSPTLSRSRKAETGPRFPSLMADVASPEPVKVCVKAAAGAPDVPGDCMIPKTPLFFAFHLFLFALPSPVRFVWIAFKSYKKVPFAKGFFLPWRRRTFPTSWSWSTSVRSRSGKEGAIFRWSLSSWLGFWPKVEDFELEIQVPRD